MVDIHAALSGAQLPERSVAVCLRGDLTAEIESAERELRAAEADPGAGMEDAGRLRELAEHVERLRDEMRAASVDVRLRALPRWRWSELMRAHPPRDDSDSDKALGVNEETFFDALVRACLVEPELSDEDWARLLSVLTSAQYDALATAAWTVNRGSVDVPKSLVASRILRTYADE
jgi:hypothetical protein